MATSDAFQKSLYKYEAPWTVYSVSWSNRNDKPRRIACTSFIDDYINHIQIVQLNESTDSLEKSAEIDQPYPPTKVMFMPPSLNQQNDLLMTSGDNLRIYEISPDSSNLKCKTTLNSSTETFSPSTSFDWNTINIDRVCSCSIDTTCSVWSVETGQLVKKLIAHDKEVFDVSFAANPDIFGTVGGDGSLRMFDLRSLEHSTILYESQGLVPLLRLQWNKFDPNFIATFAMDSDKVIIIDVRQPAIPYTQLKVHRNSVNAISWAPNKATQLCSASDDHKALIWDIAPVAEGADPQVLQYEAEAEVNNIVWATLYPEWVCASVGNQIQALRV
ncbi:wd-repeat protein [Entamoeba histolytica]|uniref:WD-repeat protein n=7 Tax=Entamoeba TaxID=5758 RepID=C4LWU1_ENTH1|nr:WD-repeat protein [Entamoeba histolytica HM-1:IMSS]EAL49493.1 WD-repeat protein [Entamoeba histolytica HM-1:IMSS]EMD46060.1 WD domain containing protein [Entamoeba histolytica KU27]BAN38521.1 WD-repeat protein [Entamoeba histolytica]GAT93184.1 wd-repeat protein [Entamoeba histolytica]|eukprot:XP_654879.1 WD-repeat protein [Entamoeba histolytica HM-1:IMSS]